MKSMRIGYVAETSWSNNRRVLHGLALCCQSRQWVLDVWNTGATTETLAAINKQADGFVLGHNPRESIYDRAFDRPTVSLAAHREHMPLPRVLTDDSEVGRVVADYLFDQGFRHLAFVGDAFGGWWSARREVAFRARAEELGATCFTFAPDQPLFTTNFAKALRARDRACLAWLRQLPRPVGLMGCNDGHASRVIDLCRRLKLRVPEDIAVVGVDNDDLYVEMSDPPMSSVTLQNDRLGYEAGELLARLLEGHQPPAAPVVVAPGELVVRRSSDTLAISDPVVASALRFIRQHLPEQAGVKQLLAELLVSRSALDERFLKALGRTAAEEVRRARIAQAKRLLCTIDLPMPQVARRAGFSCARQLSRTFHHETGQTPSAYRRRFRVGGAPD
jgi:LacI family transcriptional regulator